MPMGLSSDEMKNQEVSKGEDYSIYDLERQGLSTDNMKTHADSMEEEKDLGWKLLRSGTPEPL